MEISVRELLISKQVVLCDGRAVGKISKISGEHYFQQECNFMRDKELFAVAKAVQELNRGSNADSR